MASSPSRAPSVSSASSGSSDGKRPVDPITRTALRYTISPREYELLHQYLISRAPQRVQRRTPKPVRYEKITKSTSESGDYNVAAVRAAFRVFVVSFVGLKSWEQITTRLASRRGTKEMTAKVEGISRQHPNARYAGSFALMLLFHRLLSRFFKRLRASLLEQNADPFRKRNPRVSQILTGQYTPAIGASLAGLCLGVAPSDQLRMTLAIYVLTRSLEFGYNALEEGGMLWKAEEDGGKGKPWWFGSWMIMPFACGQLLHAFVFDRECFPESYGRFILGQSPEYIQLKPSTYAAGAEGKPWPGTFDIVDALAELSKLRWPSFTSPILFPKASSNASTPSLAKVAPITAPAHPAIKHTSCALLHPHNPSCAQTYVKYWLRAFPSVARFFAMLYGAFALLAYKSMLKAPMPFVNRLSERILRMSLFITGAIGTSWGSICLFSNYIPRNTLPTQRWFLGGFLGGLWAFVARHHERSNFLYSARLSIDSFYKVGKKRGWWRGLRNGDVMVFVASLALLNCVYEANAGAVKGAMVRKAVSSVRGEGWQDKCAAKREEGNEDSTTVEKKEKDA
ncbi:hypothetical protein D0864_12134 [Hortaea werneckii]|uniref:Transmembrane protein 135 N-terminal domain-containing protein n=1 Tax=Hortaea werneckii TaxID=91943 RepID=A0A3M7DMK6_HORWE|nr:hypothetical protein KC317_g12223 [Hortaea werneckii]RMY65293.1 hypothetical protein D0864_12134 [Hortaea werneckii]